MSLRRSSSGEVDWRWIIAIGAVVLVLVVFRGGCGRGGTSTSRQQGGPPSDGGASQGTAPTGVGSTPPTLDMARVLVRMGPVGSGSDPYSAAALAALKPGRDFNSPEVIQAAQEAMFQAADAEGVSREQFWAGYQRMATDQQYRNDIVYKTQVLMLTPK